MPSNQISCVYYPTTALFIDDSNRFLNHIALTLDKSLLYKLYNDPTQALTDLQKGSGFNKFFSEIISTDLKSNDYGVFTETHPLSLNISKLFQTVYDPLRFSQVLVVVVDYAMPKMNGLEFCEQLKDSMVKKIMLTGEADEVVAVNAFNKGLIDKFIVKNQPEVGKLITETIRQLQRQSFQDLSALVIKGLASEPNSCLSNPAFIHFFNQLLQDLHITDYYLIDSCGSFLLLDRAGQPIWFIIKHEEDLEDLVIQATETHAPIPVIEALKKREKIAYFHKLQDYVRTSGDLWKNVLYPAKKLEDIKDQNYFYCIVKELPTFTIESNKIIALKNYIEKNRSSSVV